MVLRVRNSISGFRSPVDSTVRPFDCSQGKRGGRKADRDALAAASGLQFMLPQPRGQRLRVLRIFLGFARLVHPLRDSGKVPLKSCSDQENRMVRESLQVTTQLARIHHFG